MATSPIEENIAKLRSLEMKSVPFADALGTQTLKVTKDYVLVKLPYAEHLVGNPETGVVHGGVMTAMLDNTCGIAVRTAVPLEIPIATLDLRIDYMRAAAPGETIFARASCYKVTRQIAFVRGVSFTDDEGDPIAHCTATFMLASNNRGQSEYAKQEGQS